MPNLLNFVRAGAGLLAALTSLQHLDVHGCVGLMVVICAAGSLLVFGIVQCYLEIRRQYRNTQQRIIVSSPTIQPVNNPIDLEAGLGQSSATGNAGGNSQLTEQLLERTQQRAARLKSTSSSGNGLSNMTNCVICLGELSNQGEESPSLLGCNHMFHMDCIWQWMEKNRTCPICRTSHLSCFYRLICKVLYFSQYNVWDVA